MGKLLTKGPLFTSMYAEKPYTPLLFRDLSLFVQLACAIHISVILKSFLSSDSLGINTQIDSYLTTHLKNQHDLLEVWPTITSGDVIFKVSVSPIYIPGGHLNVVFSKIALAVC